MRLGRRIALTGHMALRHGQLLHLCQRLAGLAVEHEDHALLGHLQQRGVHPALGIAHIDQSGLGRNVEVPQIVVHGLVEPARLAGADIHGHDGGAVLLHLRSALGRIEVRRRIARAQIGQAQSGVIGHAAPDIGRVARIGLSLRRRPGDVGIARVPGPDQLAAVHIEGAHHARGLVGREIVGHAAAHDHQVLGHQRRRGLLIPALLDLAHALGQIQHTVLAEVGAWLARIGIERDQSRIDGGQKQTTPAAWRNISGLAEGTRGLDCGLIAIEVTQTSAALPVG